MSKPLVSVIIPFYNRAGVLACAIDSALAQTYPRIEVLLSDDGSTDGGAELAASYARDHDNVVSLRTEVNRGSAAARNAAIERAAGEYIAFLDSDDIWYPEKLDRQVSTLAAAPSSCAVCQCGCRIVKTGNRSGTVQWRPDVQWESDPFRALVEERMSFQTSGLMIERSALVAVGLFNERMRRSQDAELLLRLFAEYGYVALDEILCEFHLEVRSGHYAALRSVISDFDALDSLVADRVGPEVARRFRASRRMNVAVAALRERRWREGLSALDERLGVLPSLNVSDLRQLVVAVYSGLRSPRARASE